MFALHKIWLNETYKVNLKKKDYTFLYNNTQNKERHLWYSFIHIYDFFPIDFYVIYGDIILRDNIFHPNPNLHLTCSLKYNVLFC